MNYGGDTEVILMEFEELYFPVSPTSTSGGLENYMGQGEGPRG